MYAGDLVWIMPHRTILNLTKMQPIKIPIVVLYWGHLQSQPVKNKLDYYVVHNCQTYLQFQTVVCA